MALRDANGRFVKGCKMTKEIKEKMKENHPKYWLGKKREKDYGIFKKDHRLSEISIQKMKKSLKGKVAGDKNFFWIDGRSKDKTHVKNIKQKARIKRRTALMNIPNATIQVLQRVYEDNILKYNTLTCVYCLKSLEFGGDSIDHIIPISRKGNNDYDNLCVACTNCNSRKGAETAEEFNNGKKK